MSVIGPVSPVVVLHGIEVYANTGVTHLTKLITLNNKILRILQNKPL